MKHAHNFKDIAGLRFGRLTALRYAPEWKEGYWRVRCDCGIEFFAEGTALRKGRTRSCGCLRQEMCRELGKAGYGVGKRPRRLLASNGVSRVPGTSDYLAGFLGCSRTCINHHVRTGKPVRGYTITVAQL